MDRRAFFGHAALATGLVGLGTAGGLALFHPRSLSEGWRRIEGLFNPIEDRIIRHFDYLALDPEGVRKFADAHRNVFGSGMRARRDRKLYRRYLLSTDFFPNGADESREVRFVTFYDPRTSPCYNPLAQPPVLDDSDTA